jgi:hypothetical protein
VSLIAAIETKATGVQLAVHVRKGRVELRTTQYEPGPLKDQDRLLLLLTHRDALGLIGMLSQALDSLERP